MDIRDYIIIAPDNDKPLPKSIEELISGAEQAYSPAFFAVKRTDASAQLSALSEVGIAAASFAAPGVISPPGIVKFRGEIFSDNAQPGPRLAANLDVELEPWFIEWHDKDRATVDYRVVEAHPSNIQSVVISYARRNNVLQRLGHVEFAQKTQMLVPFSIDNAGTHSRYAMFSLEAMEPPEDESCGTPEACERAVRLPAKGKLPQIIRLSVALEDSDHFTVNQDKALHRQYFVDTTNIALKRIGQPTKLVVTDAHDPQTHLHAEVAIRGPSRACHQSNTATTTYGKARQNLTFVHEIGHLLGAPHSALIDNVMSLKGVRRRKLTWDENARKCIRG